MHFELADGIFGLHFFPQREGSLEGVVSRPFRLSWRISARGTDGLAGTSIGAPGSFDIEAVILTGSTRKDLRAPLVSVCIVTYNDAEELSKTLNQIRSFNGEESLKNSNRFEVIISDNCSEDNTSALAAEFLRDFQGQVRYQKHKMNIGFRGNLESCVKVATGDWILFLGAGDLLKAQGMESLLGFVGDASSNVIFYDSYTIDVATGDSESSRISGNGETPLFSRAPIPIFRRVPLENAILHLEPISGDSWPQVEWALELGGYSRNSIQVFPKTLIGSARPVRGWWSGRNAFFVPLSIYPVIRRAIRRNHISSDRLRKELRFRVTMPALWIYQSRVVHNSRRPSLVTFTSYWTVVPFSLSAILAWVGAVVVAALPIGALKRVAQFVIMSSGKLRAEKG